MKGFDFVLNKLQNCQNAPFLDLLDVKKGQSLILQGQVLDYLYWIESGLLREYHQNEESEFTTSFLSDDNYYLTGFYFGGKIKSSFTVEALEDSRIVAVPMDFFSKADLVPEDLLYIFKEVSKLKYHHNLQWKLINGKRSFINRWEYFKKTNPGLWIRIPQKHLASYFNVTPQYISKLKAQRRL
jgi:CRP-like cAMP-binding protein